MLEFAYFLFLFGNLLSYGLSHLLPQVWSPVCLLLSSAVSVPSSRRVQKCRKRRWGGRDKLEEEEEEGLSAVFPDDKRGSLSTLSWRPIKQIEVVICQGTTFCPCSTWVCGKKGFGIGLCVWKALFLTFIFLQSLFYPPSFPHSPPFPLVVRRSDGLRFCQKSTFSRSIKKFFIHGIGAVDIK